VDHVKSTMAPSERNNTINPAAINTKKIQLKFLNNFLIFKTKKINKTPHKTP
jgi:hypothetical protein